MLSGGKGASTPIPLPALYANTRLFIKQGKFPPFLEIMTDRPTNQPTDRPSNAPTDQQTDTWGFIVNSYTSIRYKHLTLRTWNMDRSLVSTRIKVKKERRKKEKMEGKMEWSKKLGRTYIYQQNEKYKTHNANNAYCLEFVMTVF